MNYIDRLESAGALPAMIEWLRKKKYKTLQQAWEKCDHRMWMTWLMLRSADKYSLSDAQYKEAVMMSCDCAMAVVGLVRKEVRTACSLAILMAGEWISGDWSTLQCRSMWSQLERLLIEDKEKNLSTWVNRVAANAALDTVGAIAFPQLYIERGGVALSGSACWMHSALTNTPRDTDVACAEVCDIIREHFPKAPKI